MQLNLMTSMVVLLTVCSHGAFSETIAAASYKNVCKQFEQEGIVTAARNHLATHGRFHQMWLSSSVPRKHSRRRNNLVANSDIIVGVNMTEISTYTDVPDNKSAIANDAAVNM